MDIVDFFSEDSVDMHSTPEQLQRQDRRSDFKILQLDLANKSGTVRLLDDDSSPIYETSLTKCQCDDFQHRQLPCAHMYQLASKFGIYRSIKPKRSTELIADFSCGYAPGWAFVVRPCNYMALDIMYTKLVKKIDGKIVKDDKGVSLKEDVLTQGKTYNFSLGEIFYSDLIAYEVQWGDALKSLRCSLQIDEATPSFLDADISYEEAPVSQKGIHITQGRIVRRYLPVYGNVHFSLYHPNTDKSHVEKVQSFSCRQDEFLQLLRTGTFTDTNGKKHTIMPMDTIK